MAGDRLALRGVEIPHIEHDVEDVEDKLRAYEKGERQGKLTEEDRKVLQALRAAASGKNIINIREALLKGGRHTSGLPVFGFSRADHKEVWTRAEAEGSVAFDPAKSGVFIDSPFARARAVFEFPPETLPITGRRPSSSASIYNTPGHITFESDVPYPERVFGVAEVPVVPLYLRPDNLAEYFLLWDATWTVRNFRTREQRRRERRERIQQRLVAMADPILLRPVSSFVYEVVAVWDLSDIEKAALTNR